MSIPSRRAFITGVFGQDGSYLAEYLLTEGYEVLGLAHAQDSAQRIGKDSEEQRRFSVHVADLVDLESFKKELTSFSPDLIYNLAAVSDLKTAREYPERTMDSNFHAFRKLVECATSHNPKVRVFQALSSRILTPHGDGTITETSTLMEPQNAYDAAKRASYEQVILPYREKGFFVSSGFLCNHESPKRGNRFVTGKIAETIARISQGIEEMLLVGNVNAQRDWSYAGDFVRAMHAIMSLETSGDFVIGSEKLHTVREFIDAAFTAIHMPLTWSGEGIAACAHDDAGKLRIAVDAQYYQPDENPIVSNTEKLRLATGWAPTVSFEALVAMMVQAELRKSQS